MKKSPAFNFYSSDFLTSTTFWTNEQVGAYIRLLCYQHQFETLTLEQIKKITNDEEVISKFKVDKKGRYFNTRLKQEMDKKREHCEKQRENILKRWGKKGDTNVDTKNIPSYKNGKDLVIPLENENEIEIRNINNNLEVNKGVIGGKEETFITKQVIDYLNKKIGSSYRYSSKSTTEKIKARLNEGYCLDDFIVVIDKKVLEWGNDEKMKVYLRPETLFGTKFESYLNQPLKKLTINDIDLELSEYTRI